VTFAKLKFAEPKFARLLCLAPLQIAQALVGFGAIAAFTRLMSADQFGQYALALSVSMFAHTLVFTWAEAAAYRFYAAAKAEKRLADHFATLLGFALALGAAAMITTAALLLLLGVKSDVAAIAAFAAGSGVFRFLTRLSRETERASLAIGRYALAETAYLTLGFGAGVALLIVLHLGAAAPFAGLMVAGAVVFLFDAPKFAARAKEGEVTLYRAASYLAYGAPLALAIAVDLGVQALSRIVIAHKAGDAALGAYAAAFGLARPLDLIFMAAGAALTPVLLTAYEEQGAQAARTEARKLCVTLAALALPAAIGLILLCRPLAHFMVGADLSEASAKALPWLSLAGLFAGFNLYYWSEAFQLARRTSERALIMLAPGALQIGLTVYFTPKSGAEGAAIAALIAAIAATILLAGLGARRLALPLPRGELGAIGLACAIMTGALWALPPAKDFIGLCASAAFGAALYGISLLALNFFDVRTRASAVLQSLWVRLRLFVHTLFTDRADARPR
jgi:O-antigen/teichoic acid export membrane protein